MTSGYSGADSLGSQPKKVGLALTPVSTKASTVCGMGGNCWCEGCKIVACRREVKIGAVPL